MINPEALARARTGRRLVEQIRPGELDELGYRRDLEEWVNRGYPDLDTATATRHLSAEEIIRDPAPRVATIPAFFRWLRDTHRGPWAPATGPVVTVAGGFHVGDQVSYESHAHGQPERITVTVQPPGGGEHSAVWFTSPVSHTDVWLRPEQLTLVSCPHDGVPSPDPAEREGDALDGTHDWSPAPEGYVPWGPGHPDWDHFWDRARAVAERRHWCDEYDAVVAAVGGPPRRPQRERVTYQLTAEIEVETDAGLTLSPEQAMTLVRSGRMPAGVYRVIGLFRPTAAPLNRTPVER